MKKVCNTCLKEKDIGLFYSDRRLSSGCKARCKSCDNDALRARKGYRTREQYLQDRAEKAEGRKVTSNRAQHKRRANNKTPDELTEFVFHEASRLRDSRKELTGISWHIDHIVPINHKEACGLHVAANLQVVPAIWNHKKSNKNMDIYLGAPV